MLNYVKLCTYSGTLLVTLLLLLLQVVGLFKGVRGNISEGD